MHSPSYARSVLVGTQTQPFVHSVSTSVALPTFAPQNNTTAWVVNLDLSATGIDVNLSGWSPTGLVTGASVVVRKIDAGSRRIIFNDGVSNYAFIDKASEYISLTWLGSSFSIS